ncbi:NfeD family protein [Pseudogemmobacter sp. W21_MBD1_M6]|uniref:NfeD family protein n=1 Tax=Pseudogemmobacter sp. W21_MBD1_M6 TaxID=3240271 RepID=UPI003F9A7F73
MWSLWWVWMVAGIGLAILEVIAPAFVLLGFSIGALAIGLMQLVGLVFDLPLTLVIFAIISLGCWLALRKIFGVRHGNPKIWHKDVND